MNYINFRNVVLGTLIVFLLVLPLNSIGSDYQDGSYIDQLLVIGEVEHVMITPAKLNLKARIDTGATTSSLGIVAQKPFERDGNKWVLFTVKDPATDKLLEFEKPLKRTAQIKRHGAKSMERPVVKLKIVMGNIEMEREFTLADRSKYEFPVLIGRNVLSGKYIVDVNRRFSTELNKEIEE